MYYTEIKTRGVQVSRLGFGVMRMPVKDGKIDRAAGAEMIDYAYRHGVNYYDTAYGYHDHDSEVFLGETLPVYRRNSYFLATKLPIWLVDSVDDAHRIFAEQLKKCRADYFDFYLIHSLDKERWEKVRRLGLLRVLEDYRREGKIRFQGFSFHDEPPVFETITDGYAWDFAQIQTNYVDEVKLGAASMYKKLCDKGIPGIVMEPVRGGGLAKLPEKAQAILDTLDGPWTSPAQMALRWCLGHDNLRVILSGMSTLEQVKQNVELFSRAKALDEKERGVLKQVRDEVLRTKSIPCTACGYCADCPSQVAVKDVFAVYNDFALFGNVFNAQQTYGYLEEQKTGASSCVECGYCSPLCPQGIDIPAQLAHVRKTIEGL